MIKPMRRTIYLAVLALAATTGLWAQATVNDGGILNAASYMSSKLPGGAIAQGSIMVIFGRNIGPAALAQAGFPLPTTLSGTGVKVTSGGQTLDCPLVYTSAGQVAAIMPSTTPVGNATLTVTYNGSTSVARAVRVVNAAFGTFSLNQAGSGPGVVTNFESATSQPVNTVLRSARPGQTLILYGTGLGPLPAGSSDSQPAPAAAINQSQVELYVGTQRASVAYAGRAPGFAGLDQINFVVPGNITGCAVPVAIKTGNIVSNYTTIAISTNGGSCSDPLGLTSQQLDRINSGGTVKIGNLALAKFDIEISILGFNVTSSNEGATGSFYELNAQNVVSSQNVNANGFSSIGTCNVFSGTGTAARAVDPIVPRGLDAGPSIALTGPGGAKTLTTTQGVPAGNYNATLYTGTAGIPGGGGAGGSPYLVAGNYVFNNGAGGADVKGFNVNLPFATPVTWTNKAAITTVDRAAGQTITWTGGDPNGYVEIYGFSLSEAADNAITGFFLCLERASARTFTVPPVVLLALPPSPAGSAATAAVSTLGVGGIGVPVQFTATGLDQGVAASTTLTLKSVTYR